MKKSIYIVFIFLTFQGFAEEPDSLSRSEKLTVYKLNGNPKEIKIGSFFDVEYISKDDTAVTKGGEILGLNDTFLFLNMDYHNISIDKDLSSYHEHSFLESPMLVKIPVLNVEYISKQTYSGDVFISISGVSAITALLVAPIIAIDKNSPNGFNTRQYVNIMKPALIGSAVGLTFYWSFGNRTFTLRP